MAASTLPSHIMAWKKSSEVNRMEEIQVDNAGRTVKGFKADSKFDQPVPKFSFDNPNKEEGNRLSKVNCYWQACDLERSQREDRYSYLLSAEREVAARKKAEDAERVSRSTKGKGKEGPKTPKKAAAKKAPESVREVGSGSEGDGEEESEEPTACVYCVQKKIKCVPLAGWKVCAACQKRKVKCEYFDKTVWVVIDGSQKIAESVQELVELENRCEASRLEGVWYNLQMCLMQVEQKAAAGLVAADARVLHLLELKSKGVEIPVDLEKQVQVERGLVQTTLTAHTEDLTERMDDIQTRTAWTKIGLPRIHSGDSPPPRVAVQGTKRKGNEEGDCVEGSKKKKKKKKVVETEEEV
ncbi:hypothetical protein M422DRAFT_272062 [Sphaerobolus stellatus SS14]|uniref:Zn(2)-C6 fungal-type domain-containing protein n=1 Tax=Sphaerobolus stellatus (strain SS14) TaxID=990650 RepID=A0A0C9UNC7_SPHS4|nr:hypothetical protein M422DRAFT_272062 [Sphaerobolus stellatus SS14]